jgi:dTDP-4-dehydrorhamnose reductase
MSNLVLGYGQLGKEIVRQSNWDYICREKDNFDFCNVNSYSKYLYQYDTIINCVANTNTYANDKKSIIDINFKAVCNLVDFCNLYNKKLLQISTDYIYDGSVENASEEDVPVHAQNWYSYSKLLADGYVQNFCDNYLLIRTSFKPNPFPYPKAITTQKGNFDYTDKVVEKIIKLVNNNAIGVYNVGHEKPWTIYEMALETNKDVAPCDDILNESMPTNITMNMEKYNEFIRNIDSNL